MEILDNIKEQFFKNNLCCFCLNEESINEVDIECEEIIKNLWNNNELNFVIGKKCLNIITLFRELQAKILKSQEIIQHILHVTKKNNDVNDNNDSIIDDSDNISTELSFIFTNPVKYYTCDYCNRRFKRKKSLAVHIQGCINITQKQKEECQVNEHKSYRCDICHKSFSSVSNKNSHLQTHNTEDYIHCNDCNKSFKSTLYLKKHQKIKHVKVENTCHLCTKKFDSMAKFQYHLKTHNASKQFKCSHCPKSFLQNHHLANHVNAIHSNIKNFLCFICGREFKQESNLNCHMKKHDDKDKILSSSSTSHNRKPIRKEKKIHFEEIEKAKSMKQEMMAYNCEICFRKFKILSSLTKHILTHSDKTVDSRKHKCNYDHCSQSFIRAEHLRCHINRIHLKEKPYLCSFDGCKKSFSQIGDRNVHMKTHNDEKNFSCKFCNKSFRLLKAKTQHEKIHTGLKTFLCEICKLSFMTYSGLLNHTRKIHN